MLKFLNQNGYAVIACVADAACIARAKDLMWSHLDQYGMKRGQPSTWTAFPGSAQSGIMHKDGIGQSDFLWHVRELPRVRQAFAAIWGVETNDLLTSFDGSNIFRPWHHSASTRHQKTSGSWFHVDQGATSTDFCCVQGLVSFFPANTGTGGLTVIPGSHRIHTEFIKHNALYNGDLVMVPKNDPVLAAPKRLVTCQAGDLLLWDSRCIHCNTPATTTPTAPTNEFLRLVAYVCMKPVPSPKDFGGEDKASVFFSRRVNAYLQGATTSHWPYKLKGPWHDLEKYPGTVENIQQVLSKLNPVRRSLLVGTWPLQTDKHDTRGKKASLPSVASTSKIIVDPDSPLGHARRAYSLTVDQLKALDLLREATTCEGQGEYMKAIALYRQAYRLYPDLEWRR